MSSDLSAAFLEPGTVLNTVAYDKYLFKEQRWVYDTKKD